MKIALSLTIERIENGYIVEHCESGRKRHADHDFGVAREVEQIIKALMDGVAAAEESALVAAAVAAVETMDGSAAKAALPAVGDHRFHALRNA